ncbi:phage regulatory CII family protein [Rheinheimera salexigens]|uniref:Uncharacterized protein n=1 Tax=Rheinheimera salexigens TaxID=1628148 RepID=A0A1E7Q886_9GAMM|nr:phage regulatory CII family protein [Rheinheimera salexigens]OEY70356.1 hypothetical protein BI198_12815 [Rheinheimera salexigens]
MNNRTLKNTHFSCPLDAAHFVGHQYGVERFSAETFQKISVVYNKLNPENDSNHLYLRDAVLLTDKANDNLILETWCQQRGGVFVKLPDSVSCDEELSDQLMRVSEQLGAALGEIRLAREDGVIDSTEFARIKAKLMKTVDEALALNAVVEGQVRDLPKHPTAVIGK